MSEEIERQLRPQIEAYIREQYRNLPPSHAEFLEKNGMTWEEAREELTQLRARKILPYVVKVWQEQGAQGALTDEIFATASLRSTKATVRSLLNGMAERVPQVESPERRRLAEVTLAVFQKLQPSLEEGMELAAATAMSGKELDQCNQDFSAAFLEEGAKLLKQSSRVLPQEGDPPG